MRRRAIALGLLGLGAFALAAALVVRLVLVDTLVRLPLDQEAAVTVQDESATYLDLSVLEEAEGPVTVNLRVQGDPTSPDATDDVAVWHSGTTITNDAGDLVVEPSEVVNCLDRTTAEALPCDSASEDIEGLTLTFPFDTQQRDYEVWNGNIEQAVTARYAGEEQVEGVDVYRFELSVPETVIDQTEVPGFLAGAPDEPAVDADIVYSNERVILVEPVSGKIVSSVESPTIVLQGPDGTTGATVLGATFAPTDEALATAADGAAETRDEIQLVGTTLPWALAGLGAVLLVLGLVLLVRADRGIGARQPAPAEPEPARVPQAF